MPDCPGDYQSPCSQVGNGNWPDRLTMPQYAAAKAACMGGSAAGILINMAPPILVNEPTQSSQFDPTGRVQKYTTFINSRGQRVTAASIIKEQMDALISGQCLPWGLDDGRAAMPIQPPTPGSNYYNEPYESNAQSFLAPLQIVQAAANSWSTKTNPDDIDNTHNPDFNLNNFQSITGATNAPVTNAPVYAATGPVAYTPTVPFGAPLPVSTPTAQAPVTYLSQPYVAPVQSAVVAPSTPAARLMADNSLATSSVPSATNVLTQSAVASQAVPMYSSASNIASDLSLPVTQTAQALSQAAQSAVAVGTDYIGQAETFVQNNLMLIGLGVAALFLLKK